MKNIDKKRFVCGYDKGDGKSNCGFVIVKRKKNTSKTIYVTRKHWKIKIIIFIISLLGVPIFTEKNKPL